MQQIRVHPGRTLAEAAAEAAKRGHWLVYRGGKVMEVIPRRSKNPRPDPDPGPDGPTAA